MNLFNKKLLIFFLFISFFGFSQNAKDFIGAIKLSDSAFISYKLHLIETNGKISGFSVTDLGGKYETKSNISGTYNSKSGTLFFKEEGIIYTKSKVTKYDFCFINFKGKQSKLKNAKAIKGKFRGLYPDGKECLSGEINVASVEKMIKRAVVIDKKIQKSGKISQDKKDKVNVQKSIDTLNMNVLKENQNMSMFTKAKSVQLEIFDSGKEDGDKVTIYANKRRILSNYVVTKTPKVIEIPCENYETNIEIVAENEGEIAPNTAHVEIRDGENEIKTVTKLKKDKRTGITIINNGYKP